MYEWLLGTGMSQSLANIIMGVLKSLIIIVFLAVSALILVLMERKVAGRIQNRPGPNRLGPGGPFRTVADAIQPVSKEGVVPGGADRAVYLLAPLVIFAASVALWVVIPCGRNLVVPDLNIGLLCLAAVGGVSVLAFLMA